MGERTEILERVRESARQSGQISSLLDALPALSVDTVHPILMAYIRERYLLRPEDVPGDGLMALAEASLQRYIALFRAGEIQKEKARPCSAASSAVVKKVLLMKAVQDDFGIRLTPSQAADITTVTALAGEIVRQKEAQRVCSAN